LLNPGVNNDLNNDLNRYNIKETTIKSKLCTTCDTPISDARLKALPSATLCRDCQEKQEQSAPAPYVPVAYFSKSADTCDMDTLVNESEKALEGE